MKQTHVFRVTAEICFFFAVLNVFEVYHGLWLPMAVFTAACFALGFLIVRFQSKTLRLVLSLLPALAFLLGEIGLPLVLPALAWFYYVLVMTQGNYALPLEEYRKTYTALLAICLLFVAGNIANSTIYRGQLISPACLAYTFLFLFFGVVSMRRMQMGADMSRSWKLSNALSVVGVPVLAVGGALLLFMILRFFEPALRFLVEPIGKFLLWLYFLLFPAKEAVDPALQSTLKPEVNILPYEPDFGVFGSGSHLDDADNFSTNSLLIEKAAGIGAYVVLGILLLLALYLIVKHVRRNRPLDESEELNYDGTEEAAPEERGRGKKSARMLGHARQLRRIYQTYLEFINVRGQHVGKADTSADILERTQKVKASPEAARLRELYIAARYGDPRAVTAEQVDEAQGCLEKIVKGA